MILRQYVKFTLLCRDCHTSWQLNYIEIKQIFSGLLCVGMIFSLFVYIELSVKIFVNIYIYIHFPQKVTIEKRNKKLPTQISSFEKADKIHREKMH